MVVGGGMIAKQCLPVFADREDVCIFASGVSNSTCVDEKEFAREHAALKEAGERFRKVDRFVYVSTCSVNDPSLARMPYVVHKRHMEDIVLMRSNALILRLPIVVGQSSNPYTLFNYLWNRISAGVQFEIWSKARRNLIDVSDVVKIASYLLGRVRIEQRVIHIANTGDYPIIEIVHCMETALGRKGRYTMTNTGGRYAIDTSEIQEAIRETGVVFGGEYLERLVNKYGKEYGLDVSEGGTN